MGLKNTILKGYNQSDFLTYKKAEFLFITILIYIFLLIVLPFGFITVSMERFYLTIGVVAPFIGFALISLFFITRQKINIAAGIIAITSTIADTGIYFMREPLDAIATFGYVMIIIIVFATLYCSYLISTLCAISYVLAHVAHVIYCSSSSFLDIISWTKPTLSEYELKIVKSANIDSNLTVITIFIICFATSRFMEKAVQLSKDELQKNDEQYKYIKSLLKTIKETAMKVMDSVVITNGFTEQLTNSSLTQAASLEEFTSTLEEISANTHNVDMATQEQTKSISDLINSIDLLTGAIDKLELLGNELSQKFISLMTHAERGGEESRALDEINYKISENSNQILSVVSIIEEFFERINLLSLNATIEAARAGEHGRGFAVVAEEIGKLSDSSSQELRQITTIIDKNRKDVESGNQVIKGIVEFIRNLLDNLNDIKQKSIDTLKEISNQKEIKDTMNEKTENVKSKSEIIETAMTEQNHAITDVVSSIEEINKTVQDNATNAENLRENAQELKKLSDALYREFTKGE